jgi:hypothetical protein
VTDPPPAEQPLPVRLVVAGAVVLTLLLSVWAAFLVPVRAGSVPVPVWLLPLAVMLALGAAAGRRAGMTGALLPALTWLVSSGLLLGTKRAEGDLVVPPTVSGVAYLFGGMVLWAVVVVRAARVGATPAGRDDR